MPAVADTPRRKRTPAGPPPGGWWGKGPAPLERWPNVTIDIPATWSRLHRRWESHDGAYYFDAVEAKRACDFFPRFLRHYKGEFAGEPFHLLPFQQHLIVAPLFGWKRASDHLRRFRKVFLALAKGNGKSPIGAGVALYLTLCDREAGSEVYIAAADRRQAEIIFEAASTYVSTDSKLSKICEVYRRSIVAPTMQSRLEVLSADATTKHGFNIHGLIFDEFHAQKFRDLYEALSRGLVKRRQPVLMLITTAGDDDESICAEEWEYAKRVMSGSIHDETCLPVVFEAGSEDDWQAEATWHRVNPGLGVTVKLDAIRSAAQAAAEPRKRNDFLRYHLNRWTSQATAWIPLEWWDACDAPLPSDDELAKYPGAIGIDMAQKIDLAAAPVVFRLPLEQPTNDAVEVVSVDELGGVQRRRMSLNYRIAILPAFWLPEDTVQARVHQDRVPYDEWARTTAPHASERLLNVTDGVVIDSEAIVTWVLGLKDRFKLLKQGEIGYDPAFATEIALRLASHGLKTVEVRQNYTMLSEACQIFEALVKAKRVIHGGHRLLRWNLENVAIKQDDAGRIRPVKPRHAAKRIDGIVAVIIALSRLMVMPEPKRRSLGIMVI